MTEKLQDILTEALSKGPFMTNAQGTLSRLAKLPVFLTEREAHEYGLALVKEPPEPVPCPFCQGLLQPVGRRSLVEAVIHDWPKHQECQCIQAIAERRRLAEAERERAEQEEEAVRRAGLSAKAEQLFAQSKLGERFKNRTFENFKVGDENRRAYATARRYADVFERIRGRGIGLSFNGSCGTGKTHLAAAIALRLIGRGIPVIFGNTMTLLGKLKETYGGPGAAEGSLLDLYSGVDLLVIDDLGKEGVNEWVLEKLYLIVNGRYERNLPLVITTNYEPQGLIARLATPRNTETALAIVSRLREMCYTVRMNFKDWRKSA